jgi:hypothetical protein
VKILDHSQAGSIAELVIECLDDNGYSNEEEAIPGLIQAIVDLADGRDESAREQLLDEAADLLADGGVSDSDA